MKPSVEAAAKALEQLAASILRSFSDDRPLNQIWGWNLPPLTRGEIASLPTNVATRLRTLPDNRVTADLEAVLQQVPARVTNLQQSSIGNLPSANAIHVVPQIHELIDWIEQSLPTELPSKITVDWKDAQERKLLPNDLARRLRGIDASLAKLEPRMGNLTEQVAAIEAAHAAAESLPTDLQTLEEARQEVEEGRAAAAKAKGDAETALAEIEKIKDKVAEQEKEAAQLVKNCGEAYRIATTKGLAAAFDTRAKWLNVSVVLWILGLGGALGIGAFLAWQRLTSIQALLAANAPAERLWVHVALAILSVGGPIWFAWIATKQIGQRFRLAEDYAFKASVAKAYEGYRREAARIDPQFEARLFASALTRLEEEPLRLVEHESYGSPWHELTASPAFAKALSVVPELKAKYLDVLPGRAASGATALMGALKPDLAETATQEASTTEETESA